MWKHANSNTLPPKELSIFKRVVKYYDQKQYKNGLKYAKQILGNPKFAEHGETLAMKGMLLNCLGKKEESREYVKRGLKANISSFVCWHIYGLIQKSDRKYDEAIKCYVQALRLDSENLQVLRDLSVLQMQLRNYEGCKDTRYKLLMLRPSQSASWLGYAVVHHLLGNYDIALTVLSEMNKGQGDGTPGYETSELILYRAMLMMEAGKHEQALNHLNNSAKDIVDIDSLLELKSAQFTLHLDNYLKQHLRKGSPPLFIQLKKLWFDPEKLKALETLLNDYRRNMELHQSLQCDPIIQEPPSTTVWLNYLIAQFLNFSGRYQEALDLVDSQLSATPTLVDFYVLKADIYNTAGDVITASRWMEEAQSLDTADRYINARCTKFMVQAHRLDDAIAMASKFTRGNTSALEYLSEMQCMWFLIESARTLKRLSKIGESLKLCHEVEQHYRNILDDQLDFHSYCLRKGTLRAYIETVRLEDRLRDHPSYFDVAHLAIKIYLQLHARPLGTDDDRSGGDQSNITTSEAKKLRNKQRKAARRAEAEAARARAEQERREQAIRSRQPAGDETDPDRLANPANGLDPYALARPADPLEEACKFLRPLIDLSPKRIEVHCLAYEIYERKGKWLLMLRAIKHGRRIPDSSNHPWFHECCIRFLCKLQSLADRLQDPPDSPVYRILIRELPVLFDGWSSSTDSFPNVLNEEFLLRNANSFPHLFRGTLSRCIIDPANRKAHLSHLPQPTETLKNVDWETCAESLQLLKTAYINPQLGEIDASVIDEFRIICAKRFPMANAFFTEQELDALRSKMVADGAATAVSGVYVSFNAKDSRDDGGVRMFEADQLVDPMEKLTVSNEKLMNGEVSSDRLDESEPQSCRVQSVGQISSSPNEATAAGKKMAQVL
ncbi:N-alpha-acetyltransferase 15/16, NatA auxiliary subunit [Paragonimus westermani]|uniref:N-alpha-acetyltransferase 15/16, NatA auxiliary subunit n=1 Tax=Paragonimus westermani TaxID=34504 RepID=A0A5J4NE37_9TREM|nr:N-alpha-acetyltransferase 15/16, NatA auxiliary subunit [Paragonimus westermani]